MHTGLISTSSEDAIQMSSKHVLINVRRLKASLVMWISLCHTGTLVILMW